MTGTSIVDEVCQGGTRKGMVVLGVLLLMGLLPLAAAQDVVIELGPTNPSPCVGEPLVLDATATNLQSEECTIPVSQSHFVFRVEDSRGGLIGRGSFYRLGLHTLLLIPVAELSSATFAVPSPLLTIAWRKYSGGTIGPLPPGEYHISWKYRPDANEECSVQGEGRFRLTVLPRDEERLKETYAALIDRARAAYEGDLPRIRRINEREVVDYLLECSTDPAAVPYLEELLQSGSKSLRMTAVRGLLRVRNENAAAILQRFAERSQARDWERSQIEKWLQADKLPEPWEEWW